MKRAEVQGVLAQALHDVCNDQIKTEVNPNDN